MSLTADYVSLYRAPAETLTPMVQQAEDALAQRAPPNIVQAVVATIMAGYRNPDYHSAADFARMAAEAIEDYPAVTLARLASPKTGILRQSKFPPSIAELVSWCEADLMPIRTAIEKACHQIERQRQADRQAQAAIDAAAEKAYQKAEWEADAPNRQKRAEEAKKAIEEAAARTAREAAKRKRIGDARARWTQALFAKLLELGGDWVEKADALSEADQDEATYREAERAGAGVAFLLARLGVDA